MSWTWQIEKRPPVSGPLVFVILAACLAGGIIAASLLFAIKGIAPWTALWRIFQGSFGSWYGGKETVTKAIPLILVGCGLAVTFRGRFWNIGAEGQILMGATAATGVAVFSGEWIPSGLGIPAMFLAGFLAGAAWGLVPAWLRVRHGINEAISTLMLNYVAAEFVQFLIYGPWKGKSQMGMPMSDDLSAAFRLPTLAASRIHTPTLVLAILAALGLAFLLSRTRFGFEVRVVGENPEAAHYAGISYGRLVFLMMLISGGLAGMAGVGELAGIHRHLTYPWSISSGYGFTAIITAFLARLHPGWVILSSLFFGGMLVGGDVIQTSLGLPFATVHVFNGMILLALIAGDFFLEHRVRIRTGKGSGDGR